MNILENNLEILYQQTLMNNDYSVLEKTTFKSITKPMKLGINPVYTKTSQLEEDLLYNGTAETQQYLYPPLQVAQPPPRYSTELNYGIHQNITTKPIDVSGQVIPNNELRVLNNRGSAFLNRPQIIAK